MVGGRRRLAGQIPLTNDLLWWHKNVIPDRCMLVPRSPHPNTCSLPYHGSIEHSSAWAMELLAQSEERREAFIAAVSSHADQKTRDRLRCVGDG